jgi:hypothetical protein
MGFEQLFVLKNISLKTSKPLDCILAQEDGKMVPKKLLQDNRRRSVFRSNSSEKVFS